MKTKQIHNTFLFISLVISSLNIHATNYIKIKISDDKGHSDEIAINFKPGATPGFDKCCDAWKIFAPNTDNPNLFTKTDNGGALSINALPPLYESNTIDIFARIEESNRYLFIVTEVGSGLNDIKINMLDNATGKKYSLVTGCAFTINLPKILINDPARFNIHFNASSILPEGVQISTSPQKQIQTISIQSNGQKIDLAQDTLAKLTIFTGKNNGDKIYLAWNIANQQADGVYILYLLAISG